MSNLIPIEFKKQRIITTKVLAEEYGATEKNIQDNFSNNKNRFVEGKHYFKLEGQQLKEFKNSLPDNIGEPLKFAPQLILWTDRGAARHAKILDTDEAWEVYEALEETYFRVKENKPQCIEDVLIKSLQEMKAMRYELTEAKKQTAAVEQRVEDIREVITINPKAEWRKQTNKLISKICYKLEDYKTPKDEIYRALEERAKCKLSVRLRNLQGRAALNGMVQSQIDKLNNLDVIDSDVKLKEIYISIVKEMAIKHGIRVENEVACSK